jgi:hypothetical protein
VTGAGELIRLMGQRTRCTTPTPLLRGQADSAVMPLLSSFASRCQPVCGPLLTTRWQLPAVIEHGMEARGLAPR